MEKNIQILWVDDEIDLLKSYIMFLKEKGYEVFTATNGEDAIQMVSSNDFDLIFLDENMPGINGIETLGRLKAIKSYIPVVMITKSEEEDIMEEAIATKIADYLIKPVNPNQILLSIKKNIDTKRLVSEKTSSGYQSEFNKISQEINTASTFNDWMDIYKRIIYWELELQESSGSNMDEILAMQKMDANKEFSKYIVREYPKWFSSGKEDMPLLSPSVFKQRVFPLLEQGEKVFFILIDNLRFDQWKIIEKEITGYSKLDSEEIYCSILPTATQYCRNAMFAGLLPYEIYKLHPELWVFDEEEVGKNLHENELFQKQLSRLGLNVRYNYNKILNQKNGKYLVENYSDLLQYDLNIIVYNFVDMLSHARTEMDVIKELADNEASYRSLTSSWFNHSHLFELLKKLSGSGIKLILTTDHGSIKVQNPVKIIGDKKTSSNLRYKLGRNLNFRSGNLFEVKDPESIHLPKPNVSSTYVFARENEYLVYPNNYNYFANYYKNTFQHGGISLEEMMIPLISLTL